MLDHDQLRQAQLNKALSTALLNHQIQELETQVRHLPTGGALGLHDHNHDHEPVTQIQVKPEKEKAFARIDDNMSFGEDGARRMDDEREREEELNDEDDEPEWRVAVVDVSAFMWAPQAARDLVQKGFEVIVPANGIITLDLLKKGDSPSAQAARKAARYIEHASRQYKQLSTDPSITVQLVTNYKRGSGLRFQREDEFRQIDEMSSLPLMPGEEGPPKWVQSVLGCAAYFVGINKAELDNAFDKEERELPPALYIATPSFEIQITQDPTGTRPLTRENREEAERNGSKNERGDGVMLQEEAERFELGIAILRDNDDDKPAFNRSTDRGSRRNANGLNRSSGGQGDRRMPPKPRKKEDIVPEVKVLLRRPQAPGESDQSDSPASVLLGLPEVTIPPPMGINPMAYSGSSNEPSPPKQAHRALPTDRKSPPSKFVPLTRETHPVRRYAGSSDSNDEHPNRERARSGRGRGGGASAARGSGRKNRERDSEFKNGNFVLLKRPEPPVPASPKPTTAPSRTEASIPAPAPRQPTILARRPAPPVVQAPPAQAVQSAKPPSVPTPAPVTAPARTILQRPPAPPAPPPAPAPPTAPRAFNDTRGRGRGRGGVSRPTASRPFPPDQNQNQNRRNLPIKPNTADSAVFEFDDAMLRPGYGVSSGQSQTTDVSPPSHMGMNSRGRGIPSRGQPAMRGRGSVRPPPQQQHVAPTIQNRPLVPSTPAFTPASVPVPSLVPTPAPAPAPMPLYGPTTSMVWRPAEPAKKIVLQRPT